MPYRGNHYYDDIQDFCRYDSKAALREVNHELFLGGIPLLALALSPVITASVMVHQAKAEQRQPIAIVQPVSHPAPALTAAPLKVQLPQQQLQTLLVKPVAAVQPDGLARK